MEQVYCGRLQTAAYPEGSSCWAPSERYPDYAYSEISE